MSEFFDSSVLVAAFYGDHPHNESSARAFLAAGKAQGSCCALRTLGEVYATLTGLPIRPRITGPEALQVLDQICERLHLISLDPTEYRAAFRTISDSGIVGAAAYDFLIAKCAAKAGAEVILTWNVKDFIRFGDQVSQRVRTPLEYLAR